MNVNDINFDNINLIDIRDDIDYKINHIPNALNIPENKLVLKHKEYLKKNVKYYIYCEKGKNSYFVSKYLNNIGYNTFSIKGGYEKWKSINNTI